MPLPSKSVNVGNCRYLRSFVLPCTSPCGTLVAHICGTLMSDRQLLWIPKSLQCGLGIGLSSNLYIVYGYDLDYVTLRLWGNDDMAKVENL